MMLRTPRARSRLLVLFSALCFGTTGTAQAFGPDDATPLTIGASRLMIGAAVLVFVAARVARRSPTGQSPTGHNAAHTPTGHNAAHTPTGRTAGHTPTGRTAGHTPTGHTPTGHTPTGHTPTGPGLRDRSLWWGAVGVAAYQPCFFVAVQWCGVGVGTVVALGSAPVMTGLLGWLLTGRRPGRRWLGATALAVAGVAALSARTGTPHAPGATGTPPSGVADAVHAVGTSDAIAAAGPGRLIAGIALAVAAGTGYAVYTLAAKSALDRGAAPEATMARMFGTGAVLLAPLLLVGDASWLFTPRGATVALWLGLIPTGLAYLCFARGLRGLGASETATLTLAEPATAALLGVVLLGEAFGPLTAVGAGLIGAGLLVLGLPDRRFRARPLPVAGPPVRGDEAPERVAR